MGNSFSNAVVLDLAAARSLAMRRIYHLFARVLDYPGTELSAQVQQLIQGISGVDSTAAELLSVFAVELEKRTLGETQELYTSTFDMRPDRTMNLGCHLFGEDIRRNLFMTELKKRMEAREVQMGSELPDHLSLVLELLGREDSEDESRTLIVDCLKPALTRIMSTFNGGGPKDPYAQVMQALLALIERDSALRASQGPS